MEFYHIFNCLLQVKLISSPIYLDISILRNQYEDEIQLLLHLLENPYLMIYEEATQSGKIYLR